MLQRYGPHRQLPAFAFSTSGKPAGRFAGERQGFQRKNILVHQGFFPLHIVQLCLQAYSLNNVSP